MKKKHNHSILYDLVLILAAISAFFLVIYQTILRKQLRMLLFEKIRFTVRSDTFYDKGIGFHCHCFVFLL